MGSSCSSKASDSVSENRRGMYDLETPDGETLLVQEESSTPQSSMKAVGFRTPPPTVRVPPSGAANPNTMVSTSYRPQSSSMRPMDASGHFGVGSPPMWNTSPGAPVPPLYGMLNCGPSPVQENLPTAGSQNGSILIRSGSNRTAGSAGSFRQGGFRKHAQEEDEEECVDRVTALMKRMSNKNRSGSASEESSKNQSFASLLDAEGSLHESHVQFQALSERHSSAEQSQGPLTPRRDLDASVDLALAALGSGGGGTHRRSRSVNFVS
ncbi:hypothetical protein ADEAN_000095400 [Angomonas deanei]|uniref:Uncharacterized protein n=1 Tax=Angomonas deanei TaxID=59799 RepID=A0A7G2C2T6_9TRYP|nr:hypothetical protein ADEAN_000095400 [Angomonas deanei]